MAHDLKFKISGTFSQRVKLHVSGREEGWLVTTEEVVVLFPQGGAIELQN